MHECQEEILTSLSPREGIVKILYINIKIVGPLKLNLATRLVGFDLVAACVMSWMIYGLHKYLPDVFTERVSTRSFRVSIARLD